MTFVLQQASFRAVTWLSVAIHCNFINGLTGIPFLFYDIAAAGISNQSRLCLAFLSICKGIFIFFR